MDCHFIFTDAYIQPIQHILCFKPFRVAMIGEKIKMAEYYHCAERDENMYVRKPVTQQHIPIPVFPDHAPRHTYIFLYPVESRTSSTRRPPPLFTHSLLADLLTSSLQGGACFLLLTTYTIYNLNFAGGNVFETLREFEQSSNRYGKNITQTVVTTSPIT